MEESKPKPKPVPPKPKPKPKEPKVLLITKQRGPYAYTSSGLRNSVGFICEMLNNMGIDAKTVDVVDNNAIDKEVYDYRPSHVIIEAFWVVPKKFKVLKKLHPDVKWIVRDHSDFPFMETEGVAIRWMFEYVKQGITIGCNKRSTALELGRLLDTKVAYLPNYYPVTHEPQDEEPLEPMHQPIHSREINIGCFGAIRPLKNQLVQAIAAIRYADAHNKRLTFYVNSGRVESCGDQVVKNLRALFGHVGRGHILCEVPWLEHDAFIFLLKSKIDLSMQVSLSETFNIVTADAVNCCVPVVVSPEVWWVSPKCMVSETTNIEAIVKKIEDVLSYKEWTVRRNKELLVIEGAQAMTAWGNFLKNRKPEMTWAACLLGWCFKRFRSEDPDAV